MMQISEVAKVNVAALSNTRLDELLDRHVFGQAEWCRGDCELRYMGHVPIYQCKTCSALEERTLAQHIFGSNGHRRLVPKYTESRASARSIFDAVQRLGRTVQSCFTLNLCLGCPIGRSMQIWVLFDASPRQIAVAALQAMGIVDAEGYIIESEAI